MNLRGQKLYEEYFSKQKNMKLEINYKNKNGKRRNMWKLSIVPLKNKGQ